MSATPTDPEAAAAARQAPNAWKIVGLLAVANLLNFYDRTIPAIVVEPVKEEFGVTDAGIGVLAGSFTVIYAVAGIALGRLADRVARRKVMAVGLVTWSVFTALSGGAWSFTSLLIVRMGVGVGEASFAPAANSTIADLFPPHRRSKAVGIFQLGLPVGILLAFFTTGAIVDATGSFRAPFFIAAVPGLLLALVLWRMDEPIRGASEEAAARATNGGRGSIVSLLRIPTMRRLIAAGIGFNICGYAVATFVVPLLQRYYGLSLTSAAVNAGFILGVTGLAGLLVGGWASDRAARRSPRGRLLVGAGALGLAVPLALVAFRVGPESVGLFVVLLSLAWFLQYFFHTSVLPAVADIVEPSMRATAIAVFFAAFYLSGGALGPVLAGILSDRFASSAQAAAGISAEAIGLHHSLMWVTPLALLATACGLCAASRTVNQDAQRMQQLLKAREAAIDDRR